MEGLYGQEFNIADTVFILEEIQLLDSYANRLNQNLNCGLIIQAYAKDNSERKAQNIIQYLVKTKGIAEDRLLLNVSSGPNVKIIDFIPFNQPQ